jgi:energy-converting hydrogenase Eha subunit A
MIMDWLPTLGIAALVMVMVYRRGRRLFGRQRFGSRRFLFRLSLVALLCAVLLPVVLLARGLAPAIGLALGVLLGLLARGLARFEVTPDGVFFTPNAYMGIAVLSLLLGRMIYRAATIGALGGSFAAGDSPFTDGLQRSPLSAAIFALLLGYYATYYATLYARGRRLQGEMEAGAAGGD